MSKNFGFSLYDAIMHQNTDSIQRDITPQELSVGWRLRREIDTRAKKRYEIIQDMQKQMREKELKKQILQLREKQKEQEEKMRKIQGSKEYQNYLKKLDYNNDTSKNVNKKQALEWTKAKENYSIDKSIFQDAGAKRSSLEMTKEKIGVVITTHGYNGIFARQAVESFIRELPSNRFIVLFINESDDPITNGLADQFPEINVVNIEVQKTGPGGGLTGTWNEGIKLCLDQYCDVIVLANDDIVFDASVTHIIHAAVEDKSVPGNVFCPVTNAPGPGGPLIGASCPFNRQQLSPGPRNEDNYELIVNNNKGNCNGFFMVFPKQALLNNTYNEEYFFDPNLPFGGNETEWCKRFINTGGKVTVVPKTFIYHYKNMSWRPNNDSTTSNICMYSINTGGYEGEDILISSFKNLPFEKLHFTDNIRLIYKCLKENVTPFFVSTVGRETKLIQRTIKTSPHLYLPSNYDRSIYVDGNISLNQDHEQWSQVDILRLLENKNDIIHFKHPNRTNIRTECIDVIRNGLETPKNINRIVELFAKDDFKDNVGLTETNVLIRNHKNIIDFSEDWTRCINICRRDQISFDYLKSKYNINSLALSYNKKISMFQKKQHTNPIGRRIV